MRNLVTMLVVMLAVTVISASCGPGQESSSTGGQEAQSQVAPAVSQGTDAAPAAVEGSAVKAESAAAGAEGSAMKAEDAAADAEESAPKTEGSEVK